MPELRSRRKPSKRLRALQALLGLSLIVTTLFEHPISPAEHFGYWQSLAIGILLIAIVAWETFSERMRPPAP